MSVAQLQQLEIRNRLLASLSAEDFALVQPHLESIRFELRDHLFRAEQAITHVTFPESGIASIVTDAGGGRFEVGMVGSEGLAGVPIVLGIDRSPHTCLVQGAGKAFRIGAAELQAAMTPASRCARYFFASCIPSSFRSARRPMPMPATPSTSGCRVGCS